MRSMTGFGRAEIERGKVRVAAEMRSLNQRFFELKLNLPRTWGEHEAEIRKLVQSVIARGRVELFVRCTSLGPPPTTLRVNDRLAGLYVKELGRLGRRLDLVGKPGIEVLLHRPEIFQVSEEETDSRPGVRLAFTAITRALKALETDRKREGKALRADFIRRIETITEAVPKIERLAEASRGEILANFQIRLRDLMADLAVNEKRLFEEASEAAQRADITEEVIRLRAHLHGLRELVESEGTVGKQIEFLLQEVGREINTMGAKSQSAALSRVTVGLKGEVEKMREQVQNVE
ncbi:MAG TPA: YicC/YloC family endoribonuclease [Candidatus Binataceae bacterium]|jgi:uncharacterized protein (TIGR00255 family)|nr:YicC/YloC family endoribonuclease [Candidatus Binataceae bacterium]